MQESPAATLTVTLPADQAWAYAQFLKRVGFEDFRRLAADEAEAYDMLAAGEAIRTELAAAGYAPR